MKSSAAQATTAPSTTAPSIPAPSTSGPSTTAPSWSVGAVAERFALPTNVLRHWETVGLLAPRRDPAGRRRYGRDDVVRVAVILRSKAAGMSLDQIAHLLERDMAGRHRVLQAHIDDLERRMAEMRRSKAMTEHALNCSAHDISTCPRFRAELADVLEGQGDLSSVHWPSDGWSRPASRNAAPSRTAGEHTSSGRGHHGRPHVRSGSERP